MKLTKILPCVIIAILVFFYFKLGIFGENPFLGLMSGLFAVGVFVYKIKK